MHMKKTKGKLFLTFLFLLTPILLTSCEQPLSASSGTSTDVPTSSKDTGTDTSSSSGDQGGDDTEEVDDSIWGEEITAVMIKYFGGHVLPKIGLNSSVSDLTYKYNENVSTDDYKSNLTITGGAFVITGLEEAKVLYKKKGWDVVITSNSYYAYKESLGISVSVTKTKAGLMELKTQYDEPFDETKATDWTTSEYASLKEHFGYYYNIPFVYLGTTNYSATFSDDASKAFVVDGGIWDDKAIEVFQDAFEKVNWTVTIGTDETDATLMGKAVYTSTSGTTLTAKLTYKNNKAHMTVGIDETFNGENQTAWSSAVSSAISSMTAQTIPYVYTGAVYPTIKSSSSRKLILKGGDWNDDVLTLTEEAYSVAGWTKYTANEITTPTEGVEEEGAEETLESITYTTRKNGATYQVIVQENEDATNGNYVTYTLTKNNEYDLDYASSVEADWTDEVKAAFNAKFNTTAIDSIIPYFYLGSEETFINKGYDRSNQLVITGGKYDARMLTDFKETFGDDGWIVGTEEDSGYTHTSSTNKNNSQVYAVAVKAFGDNCETVYKVGLFSLYTGEDLTVYLEVTKFEETADTITTKTEWSQDAKETMKPLTGTDYLPYLYFGDNSSSECTIYLSNGYVQMKNTINYDNHLVMLAKTYKTLKANDSDWNVNLKIFGTYQWSTFNAECRVSEAIFTNDKYDYYLDADLGFVNSSGNLTASYVYIKHNKEEYKPEESTRLGWDEEINTTLSSEFDGFVLPYFYIGDKLEYYYSAKDKKLYIWGFEGWEETDDTRLLDGAKEALGDEANGFTLTDSSNTKVVYTKGDDITVTFERKNSSSYNTRSMITVAYQEVFYDGTVTDWSDDTKTYFDTNLKGADTIPFVYLGTDAPTVTVSDFGSQTLYLTLVGSAWNDEVVDIAENTFTNATGWTIYSKTASALEAYKIFEDNTAYRINLTKTASKCQLKIYYDIEMDGVTQANWNTFNSIKASSSTIKGTVEESLNNQIGSVPDCYLYMTSFPANKTATITGYGIANTDGYFKNNYGVYMNATGTNGFTFSAYQIYLSKAYLESKGYSVDLDPFGATLYPTITATKKNEDGSRYALYLVPQVKTLTATTKNKIGFSTKFVYIPPYSSNREANWSDSVSINMEKLGITIPYINMGEESSHLYENTLSETYERLTLRFNTCGDEIITNAYTTLKTAGWDANYIYSSNYNTIYSTGSALVASKGLQASYTDPATNKNWLVIINPSITISTGTTNTLSIYTYLVLTSMEIQDFQ